MTISLFGAVAALLLLIIPFYAFYAFGIKLSQSLLIAIVRMILGLAFAAIIVKLSMMADNIAVSILLAIVIVTAASLLVSIRSRQHIHGSILPIFGGMFASVAVVMAFLVIMVISADVTMRPNLLVCTVAIVAGGCIVPMTNALSAYYAGLRHHAALFNYLIGNGASEQEALNYLLKRAVQGAATPCIRYIGGMMITSQPLMLWTMIAAGQSISTAVAWQAVMLIAITSAAVGGVLTTLLLARHFALDAYSRVKA